MPRSQSSNPERRRVALVIGGMICLAVAGPAPGAQNTFDGTYTGKRSLAKGPADLCPAEEDVSVTIHGGTLKFTNSRLQDFAMVFDPHPDGSFTDIYAGEAGSSVLIRGRIVGDLLEADVTNYDNTCEHHWPLTKEH
jgi:hypothetical protein